MCVTARAGVLCTSMYRNEAGTRLELDERLRRTDFDVLAGRVLVLLLLHVVIPAIFRERKVALRGRGGRRRDV